MIRAVGVVGAIGAAGVIVTVVVVVVVNRSRNKSRKRSNAPVEYR